MAAMKCLLSSLTLFCFLTAMSSPVRAESSVHVEEDWKGKPEATDISLGALVGLGIIDSTSGFIVLGTASKKIIPHGFVSDLNDSVSVEVGAGPLFLSGVTAVAYTAHLRWDFNKDATWAFYGLGGVGGNYLSVGNSNRFELFPRFGAGTFLKVTPNIRFRGEISHDLIGVGINFTL
jgi:hypothetical protein